MTIHKLTDEACCSVAYFIGTTMVCSGVSLLALTMFGIPMPGIYSSLFLKVAYVTAGVGIATIGMSAAVHLHLTFFPKSPSHNFSIDCTNGAEISQRILFNGAEG